VESADEAIEVLNSSRDLELVVLDVMMPPGKTFEREEHQEGLVTGFLLRERIRQVRPELPLVFLTNSMRIGWNDARGVGFVFDKAETPPFEFVAKVKRFLSSHR
jgi:CheY-like chemotaxis protein